MPLLFLEPHKLGQWDLRNIFNPDFTFSLYLGKLAKNVNNNVDDHSGQYQPCIN